MAEWERKFASIVRDTERSLARVKSQLRSPTAVRRLQPGRSPLKGAYTRQRLTVSQDDLSCYTARTLNEDPPPPPPWLQSGVARHHALLDVEAPSVSSLLREQIEEQQKEMYTLRDLVTSLQSSICDQTRQIRTLKEEVLHLQKRLSESGVDLKTERKLEQFKTELSRELEVLRRRQQHHITASSTPDGTLTTIAQELQSSKRILNEDMDSLQRDISLVKARLMGQESELATWGSSIRELERRQEKLTRAMSSVEDWRRSEDLQRSRHLDGWHDHTSQLQGLRHLLSAVEHRLASLEQRVLSQPPSSEETLPSSLGGTRRRKHRNPLHGSGVRQGMRRRGRELRVDTSGVGFPFMEGSSDSLDDLSNSEGDLTNSLLLEDLDS